MKINVESFPQYDEVGYLRGRNTELSCSDCFQPKTLSKETTVEFAMKYLMDEWG